MGEYSKALSSYEKSLEIYGKTLPANHPSCGYFLQQHRFSLLQYERLLEIISHILKLLWSKSVISLPANSS